MFHIWSLKLVTEAERNREDGEMQHDLPLLCYLVANQPIIIQA